MDCLPRCNLGRVACFTNQRPTVSMPLLYFPASLCSFLLHVASSSSFSPLSSPATEHDERIACFECQFDGVYTSMWWCHTCRLYTGDQRACIVSLSCLLHLSVSMYHKNRSTRLLCVSFCGTSISQFVNVPNLGHLALKCTSARALSATS